MKKPKRPTPLAIRLTTDLSREIIKEKADFLGITTNCYLINLIRMDLKLK